MDGQEDDEARLLRLHTDLDAMQDAKHGDSPSGWQCENPWTDYLSRLIQQAAAHVPANRYAYFEDDEALLEAVRTFHRQTDSHDPAAVLFGAGSSSILSSFSAWLKATGVQEVFCLQPLYFSLVWNLRMLSVRMRPVSGRHAYEPGFTMNLPRQRTVLALADPVWYAGVALKEETIAEICRWQEATGSLVFIDGSFQYMKWTPGPELSLRLDPALTVRLLCPTKALAIHGYRFAYALAPAMLAASLNQVHSMLHGSGSLDGLACGRVAMAEMTSGRITGSLVQMAAGKHRDLRERKQLAAQWQPGCGYFVFERPDRLRADLSTLMDGSYFGQKRYPGYYRFNLLSRKLSQVG